MTNFPTLSYTWSLRKAPLSGGASPYRPQGVSLPPPPVFPWQIGEVYPRVKKVVCRPEQGTSSSFFFSRKRTQTDRWGQETGNVSLHIFWFPVKALRKMSLRCAPYRWRRWYCVTGENGSNRYHSLFYVTTRLQNSRFFFLKIGLA